MTAAHTGAAVTAYSVDLINEYDGGCAPLGLVE